MTETDILDGLIEREGGYVDDPNDRGGTTHWGVTAQTLGEWRHLGRSASRAEVQALTETEARTIYRARYIEQPGFTWAAIPYGPLQAQVIDDGVLSGTYTATRTLQQALGVTVDGVLGPQTRAALRAADLPAVHRAYLRARVRRLLDIVVADPTQAEYIRGWVDRAIRVAA